MIRRLTSAPEPVVAGARVHVQQIGRAVGAQRRSARRRSGRGSRRPPRAPARSRQTARAGRAAAARSVISAPSSTASSSAAPKASSTPASISLAPATAPEEPPSASHRPAPPARRGAHRPAARRSAARPLGERKRGRVARVAPDHVAQQQRRVTNVACQRPGLVERGGERDHPVARHRPVCRFEPDDAAQRGGLADRAARVGTQRPWRQPGSHRRRATPGRPPRHAPAIPGVAHRAERRVLGRRAHRELVLVGLGQQRRARLAQAGPRSRYTAADIPRGSSSPTGWAPPRCRTGP